MRNFSILEKQPRAAVRSSTTSNMRNKGLPSRMTNDKEENMRVIPKVSPDLSAIMLKRANPATGEMSAGI